MEQIEKAKKWINEYFDWLKASTTVKAFGEWVEESTPFLDCKNDPIQIYVKFDDSGEITMSDDGNTFNELDLFSGNSRKMKIDGINMYLKIYGVTICNNELIMKANIENVYQKKHLFLQCILAINDIMMPPNIKNGGKEQYTKAVKGFFEEKAFTYVAGVSVAGKSGISHNVDFIIPKHKENPEKFITTIYKPDIQNVKASTFNLIDIRAGREQECEQIVLLNDTTREIKPLVIDIYKNYDILPVKWSQRSDLESLLKIA